jgi:hypothetical protein
VTSRHAKISKIRPCALSSQLVDHWLAVFATPVALGLLISRASAEPVAKFHNSKGQVMGCGVTRGNTTTFSNERGQATGRAERRPDGTTNFYDSMGRMIGSSKDQR